MASPLQQKIRQRKFMYFGAIVVLFTLSLIHREFIVKPQAYRLQLREEARGDVELTSSAVRLVLVGSRGLAVTMLWYNAMDKQKRNEWHELELIVKSITKLQPYFITPWLYQSWNISFNVAVECDRPRDKYYYISRGLELLAEGERRNRGTEDTTGASDAERVIYPGNPEMRHYMGFFYQLKIGSSDERITMRTLLELSCIDPVERNPDKFWTIGEGGRREVDAKEFLKFSQKYPRVIRRLREQLDYATPTRVVQFLHEHQDIPNRFKAVDKARLLQVSESTLKHPHEQFPIAPPKEEPHWPDAKVRDMTSESIDVFLFCRTWYEFAQKPLPPPDDDPRPVGQDYDKAIYRIPKQMVTQLFRQYPARAQVYIAEMLEFEGWFDSDGWDVVRSFESLAAQQQGDPELIGKDSKYHSRLAWDKSYEMYKDFGRKNGLYIPPSEFEKLFKKGQMARDHFKLGPDQMPQEIPPDWRVGEKAESVKAVSKLYYSRYFRRLANYDAFFYQAEGEKDPITTAARKFIFAAERQRKGKTFSESTLRLYDQAWQLYVHAALKYPRFAQVTAMQEELCEVHQRYLEASQRHHAEAFRKSALTHAKAGFSPYAMEAGSVSFHTPETLAAALAFWPPTDWRGALAAQAFTGNYFLDDYGTLTARLAYWPSSGWREAIVSFHFIRAAEKDQQQVQKIVPIPKRFGPLDRIEYYDGPMAKELKEDFLFRWTLGAGLCTNMSVAGTITLPGHEYLLLSRVIAPNQEEAVENWRPIMSEESRRITADRLNLNR